MAIVDITQEAAHADRCEMSALDNEQRATPIANDWRAQNHIQTFVLMMVTLLGIYLCYQIAVLFLPVLTWALALAVLFVPFQRWLESKLKRPSLAALISVLVIGLVVVVPATFVGQQIFLQAAKGAGVIEAKVKSGEWRRALETQPHLTPIIKRVEQQVDLSGTFEKLATWLSNAAGSIVKGSVIRALGVCLTFYLLFFFLRDRGVALLSIRSLSPLSDVEMDQLFSRVGDTIYATIYGTLAVASMQGLLGGLMFWWLGLSAPLLWGVVMALLAVVPVLGAFIVWIPAALFLVLEGSWAKALILILWGMLVVGTIDNLFRPILVGNRLKLHTVLAFMSVAGGLILFGTAGLILGPVALTITTELLKIWLSRIPPEIKNEAP